MSEDTLHSVGQSHCLSEDEVLAFAEGSALDDGQRDRIDQHMDTCPACLELVSSFARESQSSLSQRTAAYAASATHVTTFTPGALVSGRFRIERFVARGGMGEVYEAHDRKLNERVALKTVVCTAEDSPRAVRKLFDEVQLARRIQHRNVCRIHELHEHVPHGRGAPVQFLSMEYIDGERLGDYVRRRGRLPVDETIHLAEQLLAGLGAAHSAHVLHLDFKTDNVMLRSGRRRVEAVIMDFGLSRAFDSDARLRTSDQRQLAGSLAYMSPEQVQCRDRLGPEADIYAFGVVFFEMLTGRLPFEGDSPVALMMKRLKERPPPPSRIVAEVPQSFDTFVLKCMSRDSRKRYRDIASVSAALQAAASGARRPRWQRRLLVAAFSVVAMGGLASEVAWRTRLRQLPPTISERALRPPERATPELAPGREGREGSARAAAEKVNPAESQRGPTMSHGLPGSSQPAVPAANTSSASEQPAPASAPPAVTPHGDQRSLRRPARRRTRPSPQPTSSHRPPAIAAASQATPSDGAARRQEPPVHAAPNGDLRSPPRALPGAPPSLSW